MTQLQFLNRSITEQDAIIALHYTLKQQYPAIFGGINTNLQGVFLVFEDSATADDMQSALAFALSFDLSTRTAAQIALAQRKVDFQALLAAAQQSITDIGDEIAILDNVVPPTVTQLIAILKANEQRQRAMIKAILRIADTIT